MRILIGMLVVFWSAVSWGGDIAATGKETQQGEVRVALPVYDRMVEAVRKGPPLAPSGYALGQSQLKIQVSEGQTGVSAQVDVDFTIRTFNAVWTQVPILPWGVALSQATVDSRPVQLTPGNMGLSWSTNKAETVTMHLTYSVDARRSDSGFVLAAPLPQASATNLDLYVPGTRLDLAVLPGADLTIVEDGGNTHATAKVPSVASLAISWRNQSKQTYAISRAHYQGQLRGDALLWEAMYQVEVFSGENVTLPLLSDAVTLTDLRVDGQPAGITIENGRFATILHGRGQYQVGVSFQVLVERGQGPPQASLHIPQVPVSRFDLTLGGKKEVRVLPAADVVNEQREGNSYATVHVAMADTVQFSWVDAIPETLSNQVRVNASLYHALYAEEGVLHGRAIVVYEITRGETNQMELEIPTTAQINRITSPNGGVSDWASSASATAGMQKITVYLNRAVKKEFSLDIFYEQLLGRALEEPVAVPLLRVVDAHRQRGMVTLLAGAELALQPVSEERLTRVGENQLPDFFHSQLTMTVAHTYKYVDLSPGLTVKAVAPERKQGKFNAQADTLISIGDATMKGSATVEVDVKSGTIMDLDLSLPEPVNILAVSGPSLRLHQVRNDKGGKIIHLEFTQEMDGQFRIDINYERIMADGAKETLVPVIRVAGAEVEHGRIAVEALSAVEVSAATADKLASLDINELPQQLLLKTTNPILLAFKYVHAVPPFRLEIKITRHQVIDVQVAAIENAAYSTLFTQDGLVVTTARFTVRNSRQQFLQLLLPPDARVWSVFVDGKAEKPVHAGDAATNEGVAPPGKNSVLIRMINASNGFPVEIVYAAKVSPMATFGVLSSYLPQPDMVVTHTRWDLFLPADFHYYEPESAMDLLFYNRRTNPNQFQQIQSASLGGQDVQVGQPLRITVPTKGIQMAFEKLYANQSPQGSRFSVRYVSARGSLVGTYLGVAGTVLFWLGLVTLARRLDAHPLSRPVVLGGMGLSVGTVWLMIGMLGANPVPILTLTLVMVLGVGGWLGYTSWQAKK